MKDKYVFIEEKYQHLHHYIRYKYVSNKTHIALIFADIKTFTEQLLLSRNMNITNEPLQNIFIAFLDHEIENTSCKQIIIDFICAQLHNNMLKIVSDLCTSICRIHTNVNVRISQSKYGNLNDASHFKMISLLSRTTTYVDLTKIYFSPSILTQNILLGDYVDHTIPFEFNATVYTKLLICSEIEKLYPFQQSTQSDVKTYSNIDIQDNFIIPENITHIGFVYHKSFHFPFNKINKSGLYFDISFFRFLSSIKSNIIIDFISCTLPEHACNEIQQLSKMEKFSHITFRYSTDDTGNLALGGDWIMEVASQGEQHINLLNIYFNANILKWNVLLDRSNITFDKDKRFLKGPGNRYNNNHGINFYRESYYKDIFWTDVDGQYIILTELQFNSYLQWSGFYGTKFFKFKFLGKNNTYYQYYNSGDGNKISPYNSNVVGWRHHTITNMNKRICAKKIEVHYQPIQGGTIIRGQDDDYRYKPGYKNYIKFTAKHDADNKVFLNESKGRQEYNDDILSDTSMLIGLNLNYSPKALDTIDIDGKNFSDANFNGCKIRDSSLKNTTLTRVKMDKNTDFSGTIMGPLHENTSNPSISSSHLNFLEYTIENGTKMKWIITPYGIMTDSDFTNAEFTEIDLTGVKFTRSTFKNTNFSNSTLDHVDFNFSTFFENINFSDTSLKQTKFDHVDLTKVSSWENCKSGPLYIPNVNKDIIVELNGNFKIQTYYYGIKTDIPDIYWVVGPDVNITDADFSGVILKNVNLTNVNLTNVKWKNCTTGDFRVTLYPQLNTLDPKYRFCAEDESWIVGPGVILQDANMTNFDVGGLDLSTTIFNYPITGPLQKTNTCIVNETKGFRFIRGPEWWIVGPKVKLYDDESFTGADLTGAVLTDVNLKDTAVKNKTNFTNVLFDNTITGPLSNESTEPILTGEYKYFDMKTENAKNPIKYILGPNINLSGKSLKLTYNNSATNDEVEEPFEFDSINLRNADLSGTELGKYNTFPNSVLGPLRNDNPDIKELSSKYKVINKNSEKWIIGNQLKYPYANFSDISFNEFTSTNNDFHFQNCTFLYTNFNNARIEHDFQNSTFENVTFNKTDMSGGNLNNCQFIDITFNKTKTGPLNKNTNTIHFDGQTKHKLENQTECWIISSNVDLSGANLSYFDFSDMNLTDTFFYKNKFYNTITGPYKGNISGNISTIGSTGKYRRDYYIFTDGSNNNFIIGKEVILSNLNFSHKDLSGYDFENVYIKGNIIFKNTKTGPLKPNYPSFDSTNDFTKINFMTDASGQHGWFIGSYMNIYGANFKGLTFFNIDFSYSDFSGTDFSGASFIDVTLDHTITGPLKYSKFNMTLPLNYYVVKNWIIGPNVRLKNADLSGADLSNVSDYSRIITGPLHNNVNPNIILSSEYKLIENNEKWIIGPNIFAENADFSGADFSGANITNVDFSGANLNNVQNIQNIKYYDTSTRKFGDNYKYYIGGIGNLFFVNEYLSEDTYIDKFVKTYDIIYLENIDFLRIEQKGGVSNIYPSGLSFSKNSIYKFTIKQTNFKNSLTNPTMKDFKAIDISFNFDVDQQIDVSDNQFLKFTKINKLNTVKTIYIYIHNSTLFNNTDHQYTQYEIYYNSILIGKSIDGIRYRKYLTLYNHQHVYLTNKEFKIHLNLNNQFDLQHDNSYVNYHKQATEYKHYIDIKSIIIESTNDIRLILKAYNIFTDKDNIILLKNDYEDIEKNKTTFIVQFTENSFFTNFNILLFSNNFQTIQLSKLYVLYDIIHMTNELNLIGLHDNIYIDTLFENIEPIYKNNLHNIHLEFYRESIENLSNKNLQYANLTSVDLQNSVINNSDLYLADLSNCDISGASLLNTITGPIINPPSSYSSNIHIDNNSTTNHDRIYYWILHYDVKSVKLKIETTNSSYNITHNGVIMNEHFSPVYLFKDHIYCLSGNKLDINSFFDTDKYNMLNYYDSKINICYYIPTKSDIYDYSGCNKFIPPTVLQPYLPVNSIYFEKLYTYNLNQTKYPVITFYIPENKVIDSIHIEHSQHYGANAFHLYGKLPNQSSYTLFYTYDETNIDYHMEKTDSKSYSRSYHSNPMKDPMNQPMKDPMNQPIKDPMNQPMKDPMNQPMKDPNNQQKPAINAELKTNNELTIDHNNNHIISHTINHKHMLPFTSSQFTFNPYKFMNDNIYEIKKIVIKVKSPQKVLDRATFEGTCVHIQNTLRYIEDISKNAQIMDVSNNHILEYQIMSAFKNNESKNQYILNKLLDNDIHVFHGYHVDYINNKTVNLFNHDHNNINYNLYNAHYNIFQKSNRKKRVQIDNTNNTFEISGNTGNTFISIKNKDKNTIYELSGNSTSKATYRFIDVSKNYAFTLLNKEFEYIIDISGDYKIVNEIVNNTENNGTYTLYYGTVDIVVKQPFHTMSIYTKQGYLNGKNILVHTSVPHYINTFVLGEGVNISDCDMRNITIPENMSFNNIHYKNTITGPLHVLKKELVMNSHIGTTNDDFEKMYEYVCVISNFDYYILGPGIIVYSGDFSNINNNLHHKDYIGSQFYDCKFNYSLLYDCNFTNCTFQNCTFLRANLDRSNFDNALLINCDFTNATFNSADLSKINQDSNYIDITNACVTSCLLFHKNTIKVKLNLYFYEYFEYDHDYHYIRACDDIFEIVKYPNEPIYTLDLLDKNDSWHKYMHHNFKDNLQTSHHHDYNHQSGTSSGDPHIYPVYGDSYELPSNPAIYRMLQGDNLYVNASTRKLTSKESNDIYQFYMEHTQSAPPKEMINNGVFYDKIFIYSDGHSITIPFDTFHQDYRNNTFTHDYYKILYSNRNTNTVEPTLHEYNIQFNHDTYKFVSVSIKYYMNPQTKYGFSVDISPTEHLHGLLVREYLCHSLQLYELQDTSNKFGTLGKNPQLTNTIII